MKTRTILITITFAILLMVAGLFIWQAAKPKESADMKKNITMLGGLVGERVNVNEKRWLLNVPYTNPAMFEMFSSRDKAPRQLLVAWYGEFPGKYLTSAVLDYRLNRDEELFKTMSYTVDKLLSVQAEDGYLGVFPQSKRLIGSANPLYPNDKHWDLWGHYHCMLGLLLWYQETGDQKAYDGLIKAADYVYDFFVKGNRKIEDAGWGETNMSISHVYTLLYEETGNKKYLEFAKTIIEAFKSPEGGDYLEAALNGVDFYQMRKPRWESLHCVLALAEMYKITGEEKYKEAVVNIWESIQRTDRHNTGGFSSGEQAQGTPYDPRAIETCCTVAWIALSTDVLKLTGSSQVADEIELSTLNGILGAQHPSGRYFTYNTPMTGFKKSSEHEIVFQAIPGSPELNCCSVNGPRGIGMISDWGILTDNESITVNYYGEMNSKRYMPDGTCVEIEQKTEYPSDGKINLKIKKDSKKQYMLKLRIPFWSENTIISNDNGNKENPRAGSYYEIPINNNQTDIELVLDMSLHYWPGNDEVGYKMSIYRGPLLLAYDQRFNETDYEKPPELDYSSMDYELVKTDEYPAPWVLCKFKSDGKDVFLCDFATAGSTGMGYNTWIPVKSEVKAADLNAEAPAWGYR